MGTTIHPTAIVDKGASIGADVTVGPYVVIEGDVEIGDGCEIKPHVVVGSGTRMGKRCRVFPGACVGLIPQDLKFGGEKTYLHIGDGTTIRECVTLNRGTKASGETRIGSGCLLMAYCHVAHDCVLGDNVVIANNLGMCGHVIVGSNVNIGGGVIIHQFCRIGDHSFIGFMSRISQDVAPFALVGPEPTRVVGVNKVGLERRGFSDERRQDIKRMYRMLFREDLTTQDALARIGESFGGNPDAELLVSFVKSSERGLLRMGADE
jgi:UDP-N-acetylglucosamine acyltransferase